MYSFGVTITIATCCQDVVFLYLLTILCTPFDSFFWVVEVYEPPTQAKSCRNLLMRYLKIGMDAFCVIFCILCVFPSVYVVTSMHSASYFASLFWHACYDRYEVCAVFCIYVCAPVLWKGCVLCQILASMLFLSYNYVFVSIVSSPSWKMIPVSHRVYVSVLFGCVQNL